MKILIEGNMASGKSTYTRALAVELSLPCWSMDYMRTIAWADGIKGGSQREAHARRAMMETLDKQGSYVMERTGTGEFDQSVLQKVTLSHGKVMRVLILASPSVCVNRMESRGESRAYPLPPWMGNAEDFIYKTAERLNDLQRDEVYKIVIGNAVNKTPTKIAEEVKMIAGVARVYFGGDEG